MTDNKRVVFFEVETATGGEWKLAREYDAGSDTGVKGEPNGYQGWVEFYRDGMLKATGSCNMVSNEGYLEDDQGYSIYVPNYVLNAIDKYWNELENYSEER